MMCDTYVPYNNNIIDGKHPAPVIGTCISSKDIPLQIANGIPSAMFRNSCPMLPGSGTCFCVHVFQPICLRQQGMYEPMFEGLRSYEKNAIYARVEPRSHAEQRGMGLEPAMPLLPKKVWQKARDMRKVKERPEASLQL